jgi:hypothetical protein
MFAPPGDVGSLPAHERRRFRGADLSPNRLFEFEDLEVNATNDRQGDVADGYSAWRAPDECSEVRMTVNDEIRRSPIEDDAQLAVSEHPVLGEGLPPEGGRGRGEVDGRDAQVRVQGQERSFERLRLAAGANGKPFQRSGVDRVWPLVRPEPATATDRPGDADAQPVRQANNGGATVEHLDTMAFEHAPERNPAQRAQVVVAKHGHDGQASGRQELASRLGLQQAAVLGEIPGDQQAIGLVGEAGKTGDRSDVFATTEMEVANRRDPDPNSL